MARANANVAPGFRAGDRPAGLASPPGLPVRLHQTSQHGHLPRIRAASGAGGKWLGVSFSRMYATAA
jgi:hypothetical protein